MRRDLLSAAVAAFLLLSGDAFARQNAQGQPSQNQAQQSQQSQQAAPPASAPSSAPAAPAPSSQSTVVSPAPHEDALVAAARKAREQKKDQAGAKPARVFNNDNIPTAGGVSAVGQNSPAADGTDAGAGGAGWSGASSIGSPWFGRENLAETLRGSAQKIGTGSDRAGRDAARTGRARCAVLQRSGEEHAAGLFAQ